MAEEIPVHKIHKYAIVNCEKIIKGVCNINDADWQKIQELFAKERQWMTGQMQKHIREVNEMFYDERKRVRERYKEYNETYLGHYVQYFFWFFCVIGIVIFRLDYLPPTR